MGKGFLATAILFFCTTITTAQFVSTFAGSSFGYQDGSANVAKFNQPTGICVNSSGTVYVVDAGNAKIRKITPEGDVSTFAGSSPGYLNGIGTAAQFNYIRGICADTAGNLYVTESMRVRKITPSGVVTTLAGSETNDFGYQDGTGNAALFFGITGICVDNLGTIYVADSSNNKVRKISPTGVVTTLFDGSSLFMSIHDICINNATGTLYLTDRYGQKIYKLTSNGAISVFAGSTMGYQEGFGQNAKFNFPYCITIDLAGNLYVTDNTYLIRKITPTRLVSTLAGAEGGEMDGDISVARFGNLEGICVNAQGTFYVVDTQHQKIKRIGSLLGLNENEFSQSTINLYPNPAKETLNIEMESYTDTRIRITDISGKTLYTAPIENFKTTLNLNKYQKGMYFATFVQGNKTATRKFLVE